MRKFVAYSYVRNMINNSYTETPTILMLNLEEIQSIPFPQSFIILLLVISSEF